MSALKADKQPRTILHMDLDAFYAAVEMRENPALRGKPVIVGADPRGGKGRGVVATASYEARRYGIRSAMPISEAYRLCPQGIYVPPDMSKYLEVSHCIMDILSEYTDLLEPASIDEAFLDVTGSRMLFGGGQDIARKIKHQIRETQQLTCSIGVASNKFVSKVASDLRKPDGLVIVEPGREREFLAPLPVTRLWGVGQKTSAALVKDGITKIEDLQKASSQRLEERFGKWGVLMWRLAHGEDDRPVSPTEEAKSIGHEDTFERDTNDAEILQLKLLQLSERVAQRLRKNHVRAKTIVLKLRYANFETHLKHKTIAKPVSTSQTIYETARALFRASYQSPLKIRLLGVYGRNLVTAAGQPETGLFPEPAVQEKLEAALDKIATKYGPEAIKRATLANPAQNVKDRLRRIKSSRIWLDEGK